MKNQTLGMMIATLRKEQGMTQLELAEKMGVTDKAVSKWERDLSYPDINSIPKLAEIFHVSVDDLMQVKNGTSGTKTGELGELNNKVAFFIDLIFKVVALAMGIAVTVLSILKKLDVHSALTMLGIGLSCLAIVHLPKK